MIAGYLPELSRAAGPARVPPRLLAAQAVRVHRRQHDHQRARHRGPVAAGSLIERARRSARVAAALVRADLPDRCTASGWLGGAITGAIVWLRHRDRDACAVVVERHAYYYNPFEHWAYAADHDVAPASHDPPAGASRSGPSTVAAAVDDTDGDESVDRQREPRQAAQHDAAVPLGLSVASSSFGKRRTSVLIATCAFEPGEVRAEAGVDAAAERHVLVGVGAAQVEPRRRSSPHFAGSRFAEPRHVISSVPGFDASCRRSRSRPSVMRRDICTGLS